MRKDAPLAVDVPSPAKDSPGWVKVGVIAAVGFVIGIAWPRVMGVKLGPNAPGEAAAAAAASASAKRATEAPAAATVATAAASASGKPAAKAEASATAASASGGPPQISVLKGNIVSCKTDDGEAKKGKDCGGVAALDQLVAPRLKKLATCAAAEGQTGKLSFMVTADFGGGRMTWDLGKSSTVGNTEGITGCLKTIFQGVTLGGVAHEHPRYTVAYNATFAPSADAKESKDVKDAKDDPKKDDHAAKAKDEPKKDDAKKDDDDKPSDKPASGEAAVAWEVALVRDTPKTGQVVARLPRGTKVKIGSSKDGWFSVKYGEGFTSDGWVYRGAIGR